MRQQIERPTTPPDPHDETQEMDFDFQGFGGQYSTMHIPDDPKPKLSASVVLREKGLKNTRLNMLSVAERLDAEISNEDRLLGEAIIILHSDEPTMILTKAHHKVLRERLATLEAACGATAELMEAVR